ncbi:2-oxo acid dehydrogenase subunit E2 [Rhodococcus sp. IEGM 1366]|uniref:2-oxo acid dehydrogenase subunit E2 n=1 Tax=Rhodococcus sp. IEGM 1366 TaxID=3082223 RepID=UPI0029557B7A|nr:2-oxo acid dehydrogenase subunit E2 [Rhodococcus sp. IEGM 1366]MDV8071466.1 2-oxo acid dehydrogenase subunit E2 [Rhodococcus sp. IEGM 1366]
MTAADTTLHMIPLDKSSHSGMIDRWLVADGAHVENGDPLAEITFGGAEQELVAPANGILRQLTRAGAPVAAHTPICNVDTSIERPHLTMSTIVHEVDVTAVLKALAHMNTSLRAVITAAISPNETGNVAVFEAGQSGALFETPTLAPPNSAVISFGAVIERPAVLTDSLGLKTIGIRSMMYLSVTYDRSQLDGADAERLLHAARKACEIV